MGKIKTEDFLTPNFLVIGAPKCGTTTYCADLAQQKHIYMPVDKEPNILNRASNKNTALNYYSKIFASSCNHLLRGEGSTFYAMLPDYPSVASKAKEIIQEGLKIIYIVRDPLDRIESHINHDIGVGRITNAQANGIVRINSKYIDWSNYAYQLETWVREFGMENIMLVNFDDMIENRLATIVATLKFLGVNDNSEIEFDKGAKNIRGSLAISRNDTVSKIIASDWYRIHVRPKVSENLVRKIRNFTHERKNFEPYTLSSADCEFVIRELKNLDRDFISKGFQNYKWARFQDSLSN